MKRRLISILALMMAFCTFLTTAAVAAYEDISPAHWAADDIEWATAKGLMNGVSDTKFDSEGTTSRAMLAVVLWRYEGCPRVLIELPFTDATATWYKSAIAWAYSRGIVNGRSATTFAPDAAVTRQEFATMLYRYAKANGFNTETNSDLTVFPDYRQIAAWAEAPMKWANGIGLINGSQEGQQILLKPESNSTRAQMAAIIHRYATNTGAPEMKEYTDSNNPILAADRNPNAGVPLSFNLDTTGFNKQNIALKDLKGKSITLITSIRYSTFVYRDENGAYVTEWDWFDQLKDTYGLKVTYIKSRFDKSVQQSLTYMNAGKKLDAIPTHVGGFPKFFNLSRGLEPYVNMLNVSNSPGISAKTMRDSFWSGSYRCIAPRGAVNVLWYNETLAKELNLTDPHTLWKQGNWNWNTFADFVKSVPSKTPNGDPLYAYNQCTSDMMYSWPLTNGVHPVEVDTVSATPNLINNFGSTKALDAWKFISGTVKSIPVSTSINYGSMYTEGNLMMSCTVNLQNQWDLYEYTQGKRFNWVPFPKAPTETGRDIALNFGYTMMLPRKMKDESLAPYAVKFMELWATRFTEAMIDYLGTTKCINMNYEERMEYFKFAETNLVFGIQMNEWDMLTDDNVTIKNNWFKALTKPEYDIAVETPKMKPIVDEAIKRCLEYGLL